MINILLIDTVIQKYDFNILENYPLNSLYSGILNLIENTNDIHYFVLNNNSYKSEYHYNNNISFINIGNSINSIKEQIIDLNNKYNFKIIISINYPILISKLKENTSFFNQDKLNNFIEKNLNILYTTLSSSSKLYVDNFWVHYNKIIGVTNYQINNLITRFGNKDKFYLVKSMYNKYINNDYNILIEKNSFLLKYINFSDISSFKNTIDHNQDFLKEINKLDVSIDYLNYKKPENNTINLIYNSENNNGIEDIFDIFKSLKSNNNNIKYKLTIIKNNKKNGEIVYTKLQNYVNQKNISEDLILIDNLSTNLLNYTTYQSNIFIYPSHIEENNYVNIIDNLICGNLCFFYNNDNYNEISCGHGFIVNNKNEMIEKINQVSSNYVNNFDNWKSYLISQIVFINLFYKNNNTVFSNYFKNLVNNKTSSISLIYDSFFNSNNMTIHKLFNYETIVSNTILEYNSTKESLFILLLKISENINKSEFIKYNIFIKNIIFILRNCCDVDIKNIKNNNSLISKDTNKIANNNEYSDIINKNLFHSFDSINDNFKFDIIKNFSFSDNYNIFDKYLDKKTDDINFNMNKIIYDCLKQEKKFTNNYDIKNIKNTLLGIFNKNTNNYLIYNFISSFYINNNIINLLKTITNKNKLTFYSNIIKTNLIKILYYEHFKKIPDIKLIIQDLENFKTNIERNNYKIFMNYKKQNNDNINFNTFITNLINENFNVNDLSLNYYLYYSINDHYQFNNYLNNLYKTLYPSIIYKSEKFNKQIVKNKDNLNITFVSNNCCNDSNGRLILGLLKNLPNITLIGSFKDFDITTPEYFSNVKKVCPVLKNNSLDTINEFRKCIEESSPDILLYDCILDDKLIYYIAHGRYAPVQMVLGWTNPFTTGIDNMDYIINMKKSNIQDDLEQYTEKVINMNNSSNILEPINYENYTLDFLQNFKKNNYNIYFCGQNIVKYNEEYLKNGILPILEKDSKAFIIFVNKLPNSKIGIVNDFNILLNNTLIEYKDRIMVLPKLDHNNYCSLLKLSSVVLDSYPYGSKYSCFETICMENAFVYINNTSMKGRVSYTLFNTIGVMNGSCKNYKIFVEKAIKFATNKEEKDKYVSKIKDNKHLLFNKDKIVEEYNEIFKNCYNKYFK